MAQNYLFPHLKWNNSTKRFEDRSYEIYVAVHKGLHNTLDVYYIARNNRYGNPVAFLHSEFPSFENNFESAQAALDTFAHIEELEPKNLPNCPLCQHAAIINPDKGSQPMWLVGCTNQECYYFDNLPIYADRIMAAINWIQIANSKLEPCMVCGNIPVFTVSTSRNSGYYIWKVECSTHACTSIPPVGSSYFFKRIEDAANAWNKENS